mgnify:CR=1 FL=1
MNLNELRPADGSKRDRKRVGMYLQWIDFAKK